MTSGRLPGDMDRLLRKLVPSTSVLSYSRTFKTVGGAIAGLVGAPFARFKDLPPNHLRVRVGVGNLLFNNQAYHCEVGARFWHECFSNGLATSTSNILEIGCGCGRIAMHLKSEYFRGTYRGIDIDPEMIEYCRRYFPPPQFEFVLAPHKSTVYRNEETVADASSFKVAQNGSIDFVYSTSLFTHLLETELRFYMKESYDCLRTNGRAYMTFFAIGHVALGGRWTFANRMGNSYIESLKYPEAAVAYEPDFVADMARDVGFRTVSIIGRPGQSVMLAQK